VKVRGVLETCLYAEDLDAAARFYEEALGLEAFQRAPGRHVFFRCGAGVFLLFNPAKTREEDPKLGVPAHGAEGPGHACFAVRDGELDGWRARLGERGVAIEREIGWPGGGRSLYFRDPAGNSVELASPRIWRLEEV
jgi:catechol 2,3-dioxygenase-like lactoylglutathione lyase family enzyme